MRSNKKYTDLNFRKRVDHQAGKLHAQGAMKEPAVCRECGNIYVNRRWVRAGADMVVTDPEPVLCPACVAVRDDITSGYVHLEGKFVGDHWDEIRRLLDNEADRAAEDNPLGRIMAVEKERGDAFTVRTTTEHLAKRLGDSVQKAFNGEIRYDFSHENKLAHVWWQRN
ncbi:MAG: BCAM0308 family protein [Blastocatellales bacterium]